MNDSIDRPLGSLTYVRVQGAAEGVLSFGRDSLLAKVGTYPCTQRIGGCWHALGGGLVCGQNTAIWAPLGSHNFHGIGRRSGVGGETGGSEVHVDDFLIIGQPDSPECARSLSKVLEILERLGLPVASAACVGFLGFEVDSRTMEIGASWRR